MNAPTYVKDKGYFLKPYIADFVYWLGKIFSIQCTGKYKKGYASIWCQYCLGHTGPCIDSQGLFFEEYV